LKRHHTATHLVYSAAKKVLGNHVWQAGAEKDVDKARLDITHYDSLSDEQMEQIESAANDIVAKNMPVKTEVLPRGEAEIRYGFRIYQGGIVPEKILRIKSIGEDHEACGGIHVDYTKEVGYIKILRTKRIADGMVRLEYCSGGVALSYLREKEKLLKEVAQKLGVAEEKVPEKIQEMFNTWKQLRKK
jgi:alanyl-tRNA synthetase